MEKAREDAPEFPITVILLGIDYYTLLTVLHANLKINKKTKYLKLWHGPEAFEVLVKTE